MSAAIWTWLLRALTWASGNPAVRAWARQQAITVADALRLRAEARIASLHASAGVEHPQPVVRGGATIRIATDRDCLVRGQALLIGDEVYRVASLVSSDARGNTVYEATRSQSPR